MLLSLLFAVDLTIEQRVLYRLAANVQSKCSDRECIFDRKDLLAQSQSNSHECPIPRLAKRASLGQLVTITLAMISSFSNVVPCPKYLEDPYANSNSDRHYVYDPYSNEFPKNSEYPDIPYSFKVDKSNGLFREGIYTKGDPPGYYRYLVKQVDSKVYMWVYCWPTVQQKELERQYKQFYKQTEDWNVQTIGKCDATCEDKKSASCFVDCIYGAILACL